MDKWTCEQLYACTRREIFHKIKEIHILDSADLDLPFQHRTAPHQTTFLKYLWESRKSNIISGQNDKPDLNRNSSNTIQIYLLVYACFNFLVKVCLVVDWHLLYFKFLFYHKIYAVKGKKWMSNSFWKDRTKIRIYFLIVEIYKICSKI